MFSGPFPFSDWLDFARRFAKIKPAKKHQERNPFGVAKRNPFATIARGHDLAEAIVDAIREPLLVLGPTCV